MFSSLLSLLMVEMDTKDVQSKFPYFSIKFGFQELLICLNSHHKEFTIRDYYMTIYFYYQ